MWIPVGGAPFTLQTFFVLLGAYLLGSLRAIFGVALYLAAGVAGLPVFAGGTSGVLRMAGPTGGFLLAFVLMAAIAGMATRDPSRPFRWGPFFGWGALATVVLFAIGLAWFTLSRSGAEAIDTGIGLLPGAVLKLAAAVLVYKLIEPRLPRAGSA